MLGPTLESSACGGNRRAVQAAKGCPGPEPRRAHPGLWLPMEAGVHPRLGRGGLRGVQFEHLEPRTRKILEGRFRDKSEANKTKAVMCEVCLQRGE